MKSREIKIKLAKGAKAPEYATELSAGADLFANVQQEIENKLPSQIKVYPHGRTLIPTGVFIQLPEDCEAQIRPRSGLALKKGITVLNAPGTIDADYRGEVGVILFNSTDDFFIVEHGDRIAQMVIVENIVQADWLEVEELNETERGAGGYGHSGVKSAAGAASCFVKGEFGTVEEHCTLECPLCLECAKSPGVKAEKC